MTTIIALDIGGTQMRAALFQLNNHTPDVVQRIPTKSSEGDSLSRLIKLIHSIWPTEGDVAAIGIAVPGPTDPYAGVIIDAPNIPGWENLPLRKILETEFGVPVALGNDANLAAVGEWKFGAGIGHHHMLYLTVSTGIGGGVIINDQLLLGHRGLAGELGHIPVDPNGPMCGCGRRGHLEAIASGTGIARWVMEQLEQGAASSLPAGEKISSKQVAVAAQEGDALALTALKRGAYTLGQAIAGFLSTFNSTAIILGGGVSQSLDLMYDSLMEGIKQSLMTPYYLEGLVIARAALGDDAGLIGASAYAQSMIKA
jgi:glucokinase